MALTVVSHKANITNKTSITIITGYPHKKNKVLLLTEKKIS